MNRRIENKRTHQLKPFSCQKYTSGHYFILLYSSANCPPFLSPVCSCDLARSGFFQKKGEYICTADYQRLYGTRCDRCDSFITGEVVSALGRTYHPKCFVCSVCRYSEGYTEKSLVSVYMKTKGIIFSFWFFSNLQQTTALDLIYSISYRYFVLFCGYIVYIEVVIAQSIRN